MLSLLALPVFVARSQQPVGRDVSQLVAKKNRVDTAPGASGAWKSAEVGLELAIHDRLRTGDLSQASVRLTDLSVLQIDELTTIEILPPRGAASAKPGLDVKAGQIYFFSRDNPQEIEIQTPVVTGALRGTEFRVLVGQAGRTIVTMLDGQVELRNRFGRVTIGTGEEGLVEPGHAPTKTAVIISSNIIQWCLYYPGLLDADTLHLDSALAPSVAAYRSGDLLQALKLYPSSRSPATADERAFRASLLLAVGRVPEAEALVGKGGPHSDALRQLIAAVKFQEYERASAPQSAEDWLCESYYRQSRNNLQGALDAAQKAVELAPNFGFGWVRVANLQFSFGRVREASVALDRGRQLSPRNAQAAALAGYFATAKNNIAEAQRRFDEALEIDGFLGNAWLGRGLCEIRRGHAIEGRRDLQIAAAMEPNRSLLHSYTGKAFSNAGDDRTADRELDRAKVIDPNDPTPWLYSALLLKQDHRFNEAIDDLHESLDLNDNRSIYRSALLLDQDRAVRNANLAAIYQDNGLTELSLREASRAVNDDYANASAHLFLANSYNALRDPNRILLRYDTPFFNELLLANLLSPVGGGPLSQNVSDQEYSKLFEQDRLGFSSNFTYLSTGQERELGSQFGQFGNFSYAVDVDYESDRGTRFNNHLDRLEIYSQAKYQLGLQDTIFFQTKYQDNRNGDVFQYYDPNSASPSLSFQEKQEPLALIGYHHEWAPGVHTLLLLGRLVNDQTETLNDAQPYIVEFLNDGRTVGAFNPNLRLDYHSEFTIYVAELNQIWQTEFNTLVCGVRAHTGDFETSARFDNPSPFLASFFRRNGNPASDQSIDTNYFRFDLYCYETVRPLRTLELTAGFAFDELSYPTNYRNAPLAPGETDTSRFCPKFGAIWRPWDDGIFRIAYTRSLGGVSLEDSVRLEPTLVGGFNQALRTLIPESVAGTVDAARDNRFNIGFEQKVGSGTYLAIEANRFTSDLDRTHGIFKALVTTDPNFPGSVFLQAPPPFITRANSTQSLDYEEKNLVFTANQLIGHGLSLGEIYTVSKADLDSSFPALVRRAAPGFNSSVQSSLTTSNSGLLHENRVFILYNDPNGWFGRVEALWVGQDNTGYDKRAGAAVINKQLVPIFSAAAGADFWQFNVYGGYRFPRNIGDITVGLLNLTNRDYHLNPLNEYQILPRSFTVSVQTRLNF